LSLKPVPEPQTPNPKPQTLNSELQTLDPKPLTLNPNPYTLNPKPLNPPARRGAFRRGDVNGGRWRGPAPEPHGRRHVVMGQPGLSSRQTASFAFSPPLPLCFFKSSLMVALPAPRLLSLPLTQIFPISHLRVYSLCGGTTRQWTQSYSACSTQPWSRGWGRGSMPVHLGKSANRRQPCAFHVTNRLPFMLHVTNG
jgi:hypothetical protein